MTASLSSVNFRIYSNSLSINSVQRPYYVAKMAYQLQTIRNGLETFNLQQKQDVDAFNQDYCELQGQLGQPTCRNMVQPRYAFLNLTECIPTAVNGLAFTGFDRQRYHTDVSVNFVKYVDALRELVINTLLVPLYLAAIYVGIILFWEILLLLFRKFDLLRVNKIFLTMWDPRDLRNENFIRRDFSSSKERLASSEPTVVYIDDDVHDAGAKAKATAKDPAAKHEVPPPLTRPAVSSRRRDRGQIHSSRRARPPPPPLPPVTIQGDVPLQDLPTIVLPSSTPPSFILAKDTTSPFHLATGKASSRRRAGGSSNISPFLPGMMPVRASPTSTVVSGRRRGPFSVNPALPRGDIQMHSLSPRAPDPGPPPLPHNLPPQMK